MVCAGGRGAGGDGGGGDDAYAYAAAVPDDDEVMMLLLLFLTELFPWELNAFSAVSPFARSCISLSSLCIASSLALRLAFMMTHIE